MGNKAGKAYLEHIRSLRCYQKELSFISLAKLGSDSFRAEEWLSMGLWVHSVSEPGGQTKYYVSPRGAIPRL